MTKAAAIKIQMDALVIEAALWGVPLDHDKAYQTATLEIDRLVRLGVLKLDTGA